MLFLLLLLSVYAAMFLQLILHESGHLVFGLLTGYRFNSFRIHNWMWIKDNGKIRLTRMSIPGTGGQCLMGPPDLQDGRMPVLLYNFGGALMNLIIGSIALFISFALPRDSFFRLFCQLLALFGVTLALANGLPMHVGTVDNDGYNALSLIRDKKAVRAFWIQMRTNEMTANGVRLKDMPDDWFVVPEDADMKNSLTATIGVLACSRLIDQQRFAVADALIAHLLSIDSEITELHRGLLTCERIYIELIGENRPEALHSLLTRKQKELMKAMVQTPSVLRTEYAYALLAEHDPAKAEKYEKRFEQCAAAYPYPSEIPGERELMQLAGERAAEMEEKTAQAETLPETTGQDTTE